MAWRTIDESKQLNQKRMDSRFVRRGSTIWTTCLFLIVVVLTIVQVRQSWKLLLLSNDYFLLLRDTSLMDIEVLPSTAVGTEGQTTTAKTSSRTMNSANNNTSQPEMKSDNNLTRGKQQDHQDEPREIVRSRPFNNKTVAYITYGSFKGKEGKARFEMLVIDALRTWLKDDVIFYVLNEKWKKSFEAACKESANEQECKRVVPIYVDCPEGYYGASPCCKMDKGMAAMWENYAHYDWTIYQDDDMYIRTAYMNDFLSGLSPEEPMFLTSRANRILGVNWAKQGNTNCSKDTEFMYPWGQPALYSKAGFRQMSKAFQMGAVSKQCEVYGVTHDAGNPIVHWMMGLPQVQLPFIQPKVQPVKFDELGTHSVGRKGTPNATVIHAQVEQMEYPRPPYQYKWHRPRGFLKTSTYKMHGNVTDWTEWHTMPVSDCQGQNPTHASSSGTRSLRE